MPSCGRRTPKAICSIFAIGVNCAVKILPTCSVPAGSIWFTPTTASARCNAWNAAITLKNEYQVDHRVRQPDGSYRWMLSRAAPIMLETGAVREWVGMSSDIHDSKVWPATSGNEQSVLTGAQIRAGRGVVNWSVRQLSEAAKISSSTIRRLEESDGPPATIEQSLAPLQAGARKRRCGIFVSAERQAWCPSALRPAPRMQTRHIYSCIRSRLTARPLLSQVRLGAKEHMDAALMHVPCLSGDIDRWLGAEAAGCRGNQPFGAWIEAFTEDALSAGISRQTLASAQPYFIYDQAIVNRDRGQGVFAQSFLQFSDRMASGYRIQKAGQLIQQHAAVFDRIEKDFGVPPQPILAFWGLETDFGANIGDLPTIRSLVSLGFDCRRSDMFRKELISA